MIKTILYAIPGLIILLLSCSENNDFLPEEIYDLQLNKVLSGVEAKEFLNNLHYQPVTEQENKIGFYEGKSGIATIYITGYEAEQDAEQNYKRMTEKISPSNSPFIKPEVIKISGRDVYRVFGLGQSHFVFTSGTKLFWVSVDTHFGKKFIAELLTYID